MKKLLVASLLLASASAWAGCGVEYATLKKASVSVNGVDGKTAVLPCGRSGRIYVSGSDQVIACHTDKKRAKWVVYELTDGTKGKGTACHLIKNKGWACRQWQRVDLVSAEASVDRGYYRCTESKYDEASIAR